MHGPRLTRSDLEVLMSSLVERFALPRPRSNVVVIGHEVDFLWRAERLIVETDGAATHLTPTAFERNRRRDAELSVAGWRVVRSTWRRITEEPEEVAVTLRALLGADRMGARVTRRDP